MNCTAWIIWYPDPLEPPPAPAAAEAPTEPATEVAMEVETTRATVVETTAVEAYAWIGRKAGVR